MRPGAGQPADERGALTAAVPRLGAAERRARLATRHALAPGARRRTATDAARAVVVLHATDPASVFLSAAARTDGLTAADVERELYDDRSLVRMIGMRRTLFVVPAETAPVVQAAATAGVAATQRRRYGKLIAEAGLGDAAWLAEVEAETLAALEELGEATGTELSAAVPRLRSKVLLSPGKRYETNASITSWVLFLLSADGHIVRGRPRGSWISSQYRWAPARRWLGRDLGGMDVEDAQSELARRWLAAFGPATEADVRWWTGWTARDTRRALAAAGVAEVDLDGEPGIVLAGDDEPAPDPGPWVALLPALDPTAMGWRSRGWYLGGHGPALFDRNGNVGPTVWCDGRIVGGWAQRPDGEVVVRLLEDVGAEASAAVDAEAGRLAAWMGDVRVVPRFRTPLERELTA